MSNDLREQLAALEHEQWAHWTKYMLEALGLYRGREELLQLTSAEDLSEALMETGEAVFTLEQVDHLFGWRRQIETPYDKLTEKEKDSDREWADKAIALILDHPEIQ